MAMARSSSRGVVIRYGFMDNIIFAHKPRLLDVAPPPAEAQCTCSLGLGCKLCGLQWYKLQANGHTELLFRCLHTGGGVCGFPADERLPCLSSAGKLCCRSATQSINEPLRQSITERQINHITWLRLRRNASASSTNSRTLYNTQHRLKHSRHPAACVISTFIFRSSL